MLNNLPVNAPELWRSSFPLPKKDDHKYTRGHVLVVGGDVPMSGAARLAVHAAQRLCGMVTIAAHESALMAYAISCPAAVLVPYRHSHDLPAIYERRKCSAFLIGPGLGATEATQQNVTDLLSVEAPAILDADALTAFMDRPETLFDAINARKAPTVITPHGGEFRWLFGEMEADKVAACARASGTSGATVLLKGAETIISSPQGAMVINSNAPPTLAVAGSGDTLAGMIAALLSARMPAFEATCAAAWLHGDMVKDFGYGLMAEDLEGLIPAALAKLAASR